MCKGGKHNFELFKENLNSIPKGSFILVGKGYQGIYSLYSDRALLHKSMSKSLFSNIIF
mgnify:FL=1